MNITGVTGLTKGEIATLKSLGAVEESVHNGNLRLYIQRCIPNIDREATRMRTFWV
ncbi:MAG: hypothetical protein KME16_07565 [Scytolyngbya sp. HA4215-MV1]|nr:hypothetical protein [Scytolyngbya sp. HA4215-MV1]